MSHNPYGSPTGAQSSARTRGLRWAVWLGIGCLVAAGICAVLTVVGMIAAFQAVAESSSTPQPQDLAAGIQSSLMAEVACFLFGIAGIVLVIIGVVVRRPVEK